MAAAPIPHVANVGGRQAVLLIESFRLNARQRFQLSYRDAAIACVARVTAYLEEENEV